MNSQAMQVGGVLALVLCACPGPTNFQCDQASGTDCDAGRADAGLTVANDGGCVSLPAATAGNFTPICGNLAPNNGQALGGVIAPGRYSLTGALLGAGYFETDGGCRSSFGASMGLELSLKATSDSHLFTYEVSEVSPNGTGVSTGTMVVSPDGLSIGFGQASCSEGTTPLLPTLATPRVFKATDTTLMFDCCRSSVADAGSPVTSADSYMLILSHK